SAKAWGESTSTPVLAIHGYGDNAATFDHLIPLLPDGFYYVCLDLPNHGRSSSLPPGVTLDFFICLREIRRVLHHLCWLKCILLSHSAGGHFSLFLASLYPNIVTKLVILDYFPFFVATDNNEMYERLRYNFEFSINLDKKNFLIKDVQEHTTYDEILQKFIHKHISPLSKKSAQKLLNREITAMNDKSIIYSDNRKLLLALPIMSLDFHISVIKQINSPVLIIMTSESKRNLIDKMPTNVASIEAIKKSLHSRSIKIVTVMGNHNVHLEHPERVAQLITNFLTSSICSL
ncbi:serine hydrolase-like protein, partial [Lycorma delicatula]|uniref:serine hydrolase-like protein n=1 Tax=Lycorma delicatula TaxID=130591 RepID=UPI003F518809